MNRSKVKGTAFESAVVEFLRASFPYVERRAQRGKRDGGDLSGIPGVVCELKATREIDLAGAVDECIAERDNVGAQLAFAIIKRRRKSVGKSYVVCELEQFARLLSEEG
jgi:hypothetical protein